MHLDTVVNRGTYDSELANSKTLKETISLLKSAGADFIYVKKLAANDNSKNQPYLAPHLNELSFIPTNDIIASGSTSLKSKNKRSIKYHANINFDWVSPMGDIYNAPNTKVIYYPQYPEVRLSGFLQGSKVKLSKWMDPNKQGRSIGRWLLLGIKTDKQIYAYLATPDSQLSSDLEAATFNNITNVFWEPTLDKTPVLSTREQLINKLKSIHQQGWIQSQKLTANGPMPYKASNGAGYTLESLLGVLPNGKAEPDYLGWEVKQCGVKAFPRKSARPTTLFTPEPDGGYYKDKGGKEFIKVYGYPDTSGKKDRLNFGGKHVVGKQQSRTQLTLKIEGFDLANKSITNAAGKVTLVDKQNIVTASWSFPKIMDHWKRKHAKTVFVPSIKRKTDNGYDYHFGNNIELGIGTSFERFLNAMHSGDVYYDPGIKLEDVSTDNPKIKKRNQFRCNHNNLHSLYDDFIDIEI